MATFTVCMLTLVVVLAAALAAATTTVEIVNPGEQRGDCHRHIERQRLSPCQRYLRDSSRIEAGDEGRSWREEFPRCCEELDQINEQCRCEAVKQVVQEQRQAGGLQEIEMREMLQTAQSLPSLCRISPQYCENIGGGPMF